MDSKLLVILLLVGVVGMINASYPPHHRYGYWSPWSKWAQCNVPCGGGTQSRSRHCRFDGQGSFGSYRCTANQSPQIQRRECNTHHCQVYENWSG
ncbi:properdin-like [Watersipora subatra]|uniref:properdin-like n=1 Tax=Watersipora subatra TaxID=2589382 RepID=UPI00355B64DA